MKRVLLVINTLGRAGAERAMIELLKRMEGKGYEIFLHVLMNQGELLEELPPDVKLLNQGFSSQPILEKGGRRGMVKTVLKAFFRNGAWGVKLCQLMRNLADMIKRRRIQLDKLLWRVLSDGAPRFEQTFDLAVAWLEGGSAYYVADWVRARKKAAFIHIDYGSAGYTRRMDQGCWKQFDRIFTVSSEVQEHFTAFYPEYKEKTLVFPNFIDQQRICRMAKETGGFSDRYDGARILTVGRLEWQKAYDIAIEAMKLLKTTGCEVRWYVLGEGKERKKLEKKIVELGLNDDFLLLGAVENPYPYYRQADLYVHATRFEGKSIAIQEAQALGCPIIASDCNGNREQVEHGKDGILCELTPDAIAESIRDLLGQEQKRKALGTAAEGKKASDNAQLEKLTELME